MLAKHSHAVTEQQRGAMGTVLATDLKASSSSSKHPCTAACIAWVDDLAHCRSANSLNVDIHAKRCSRNMSNVVTNQCDKSMKGLKPTVSAAARPWLKQCDKVPHVVRLQSMSHTMKYHGCNCSPSQDGQQFNVQPNHAQSKTGHTLSVQAEGMEKGR